MGLECVMVVMDNSESSRNGDTIPNRHAAQIEAISNNLTARSGCYCQNK